MCAIYTSRWSVRNYVRVCQSGDHSKKALQNLHNHFLALQHYVSWFLFSHVATSRDAISRQFGLVQASSLVGR